MHTQSTKNSDAERRVYEQAHPCHVSAPWCANHLEGPWAKGSPFPREQKAPGRAGEGGRVAFGTWVAGVTCCWGGHGEKGHAGPELFNPSAVWLAY